MTQLVYVTAFPKSGSTYLSRLLGDALDYPVKGVVESRPLAEEGAERKGDGIVYQTHMQAQYVKDVGMIPDFNTYNLYLHNPENKIIHLTRDPRAIAVSAKFWWEMESFDAAIRAMRYRYWPISRAWNEYVESWAHVDGSLHIKYEDLVEHPFLTLCAITRYLEVDVTGFKALRAIFRQDIQARRKEIKGTEGKYPYGEEIQLKNMRVGSSEDWRKHLTQAQSLQCIEYFGEWMTNYGYNTL